VGWTAHAEETFKLLGEKEIRARVVGKDITDSSHWVSYLRPDGVLISDENGPEMDWCLADSEQQALHVQSEPGLARLQ
jgi:hypothetical protein